MFSAVRSVEVASVSKLVRFPLDRETDSLVTVDRRISRSTGTGWLSRTLCQFRSGTLRYVDYLEVGRLIYEEYE